VTEPSSTRTPANKGRRLPAELLSGEEVRALLRACSARAPASIRNRALIAVLYRGGLRISEALALLPKDVDPSQGTLTVLHGKGDRRRTVGMDPAAFALLERWMDRRQALRLSGRRSVFCTLAGEPLDSSYVRRLLPAWPLERGRKARPPSRPTPPARGRGSAGQRRPAAARPWVVRHDRPLPAPYCPAERVAAKRAREWAV